MTVRQRFGGVDVVGRLQGHSLRVWGRGQVKMVCGCCGGAAIMWGTFMSELGITLPHYFDRKPLCSECRQGLTALGRGAVR